MSATHRAVAFLRGINVGGHRATKDELAAPFAALGLGNVTTFLASGNVIFDDPTLRSRRRVVELEIALEAALEAALGYAVPTYVRTAAEVQAVAEHEPFPPGVVARSAGKLQVAFCSTPPGERVRSAVLDHATDEDRLHVHGRECYWLPSGPMSASELDVKAIESLLGGYTMRTRNTVERIAQKYCR